MSATAAVADKFQSRDELVTFIEQQTGDARVEKADPRGAAGAVGHVRAGRAGLGRVHAC